MMGKKMWIYQAQKSWDDAHDSEQKNRIGVILRDNAIRHYPLFDETIFINKTNFRWTKVHPAGYESLEKLILQWAVFRPDMLFPMKNLIIEIDGEWHTNTEKGVKQTKRRNQYYEYAKIRLVTYITKELNKMTDKELYQDLKSKL